MDSQGPGRADARANRQRILAAAREVFAERGIDADMREICARSGVGMGTLYRNFPTKDDLVVEMVREIVAEVGAAVAAADQLEDPREAVLALMRTFWQVVEVHRQLAHALHDTAIDIAIAEKDRVRAQADRLLSRAQAAGVIGQDIPAEFLMDYLEQQMDCYLVLREKWDAPTAQRLCERVLAGGIVAG